MAEVKSVDVKSERRKSGQFVYGWSRLRRNKLALIGLSAVTAVILIALFAPVISPYDPITGDRTSTLQPPSFQHPLGTDNLGRDVFSRTIHGSRPTLIIGTSTVAFAMIIGVPIGLVTGYRGGLVDSTLMRLMDAILSFPGILLALALLAALGPATRNVALAIGIAYVPTFARLARASTLSVRETDYVLAATSVGVSTLRLLGRHIFPNTVAPLIVQATVNFATAIIAAATLSFLGLGTQPPFPDWGRDISVGRGYIYDAQWMIIAPGVAISITVLAINFLGDGLRDALDPTRRNA
jgi:peptide/nickel transport system permease protein